MERLQIIPVKNISKEAGVGFSFMEKLKLGGIGSMKFIHLNGIDFISDFDAAVSRPPYLSFELRPKALVGRTYGNNVHCFVIQRDVIETIHFETFELKILTKKGYVIRHEAIVEIVLANQEIKCYVPRNAYKPLRKFFGKQWFIELTKFSTNSKKTEVSYATILPEVITSIIG